MKFPRALSYPALALIGLAAAYGGWWGYAAWQMQQLTESWIADWRAAGFRIDHEPVALGGFPTSVRLVYDRAAVADPDGIWFWKGDQLVLEALPWKPTLYRAQFNGAQQAAFPHAGSRQEVDFEAADLSLTARLRVDGQVEAAELEAAGLVLDAPIGGGQAAADVLQLGLRLPQDSPKAHDDLAGELTLGADGIRLPDGYIVPLGHQITRLSTRLRLMGPFPQTGFREALTQWRDDGGIIEAPWLRLHWGPLALDGEGTFSVDEFFRPLAALKADVAGLDETLDRLGKDGFIDRKVARMAALGARLLARPSETGTPVIPLSLNAQDGDLFLGPLRIAALPAVLPHEDAPETIGDRALPAPLAPVEEAAPLPLLAPPPTVSLEKLQQTN